jgi:hypothetical protein
MELSNERNPLVPIWNLVFFSTKNENEYKIEPPLIESHNEGRLNF